MDPEGIGAQQGASGDAHRSAVRVVVGNASATRRARSQLSHAAAISRLADHVPARMCQP